MMSKVLALGLAMGLAATVVACGDDDGPTPQGDGGNRDSGLPNGDGGPQIGPDGQVLNPDGSVIPSGDGGEIGNDGGPIVPGTGSALITSAGGKVTSADGRLTVTIPPAVFRRPVTVTIKPLTPAPAGSTGTVYDIQPSFEAFENGRQATVSLTFAPEALGGRSPYDLLVGRWNLGRWEPLTVVRTATTATAVGVSTPALGPIALLTGICEACAEAVCTEATCLVEGVPGKCFAYGNGCSRCLPASDLDNDGYGANNDCEPRNANINPGQQEICNGIDDNCDRRVDEGCATCKADADCKGDSEVCLQGVCETCNTTCSPATCNIDVGAGVQVPGMCLPVAASPGCFICARSCDTDGDGFCAVPSQGADSRVDCEPTVRSAYPDAPEVCGNGIDDDCNGFVDDNCSTCTKDADCGGAGGLYCQGGACLGCKADCDAATCQVQGAAGNCFAFGKGGSCSRCVAKCDIDGDGACGGGDIDEGNPAVGPNVAEICGNNIDDNSNGYRDEGCKACAADSECTQGACEKGTCTVCAESCNVDNCQWPRNSPTGTVTAAGRCEEYGVGCSRCLPPGDVDGDGFVTAAVAAMATVALPSGDTNDMDKTIYPGAPELCDGKDNDSDGPIDEGCVTCADSLMCGMPGTCSNAI